MSLHLLSFLLLLLLIWFIPVLSHPQVTVLTFKVPGAVGPGCIDAVICMSVAGTHHICLWLLPFDIDPTRLEEHFYKFRYVRNAASDNVFSADGIQIQPYLLAEQVNQLLQLLCGGGGSVLLYFDDFDVEFGEDAEADFEVGVGVGEDSSAFEVAGVAGVRGDHFERVHQIFEELSSDGNLLHYLNKCYSCY